MKHFTYLLVDSCTVIVPLIFSFHPALRFYKIWRPFLVSTFLAGLIFSIWDVLFTRSGLWGFAPKFLLGIYVYNLPIEELLFFICVPYACVFTFYCLFNYLSNRMPMALERLITIVLITLLLEIGIWYHARPYTAITFISLAALLAISKYWLKVSWLSQFYLTYAILLVPFFLVNGLLTGTGLPSPVVWYNKKAIIGFRLGTIPFEDIFYGMLLILLNLVLMNKSLKNAMLQRKAP